MKFEFETRTCKCGNEWEALDFWAEDMPCHDCGRRNHQQIIDDLNATRRYHIDSIGGMCPTQAEGEWIDGQKFYFRARHGEWLLRVDPDDAVMGTVIAGGDDPTHGSMSYDEVVAVLDEAASR